MDALSQAVESYWAVNSTEDSRDYAAQAIRTILKVLELAVSGDNQAKEEMSTAAHSAGKAAALFSPGSHNSFDSAG